MKSRAMLVIDSIIPKLKDMVRSKEVLGLVVKAAVHIAFDRKLANEADLRKMFEDAIKSYNKDTLKLNDGINTDDAFLRNMFDGAIKAYNNDQFNFEKQRNDIIAQKLGWTKF